MDSLKKYDVEIAILPNGLKVIVKRLQTGGVSGSVLVKCGSAYETKGVNNGISHLLEHLVYYSGIRRSRRSSPFYKIEKTGANVNPGTDKLFTSYEFNFPQKNWKRNFFILVDAVSIADFSLPIFLREQKVVASEKKSETDLLNVAVYSRIFPHHPMGLPIDGETRVVNALTPRRIKNWHRRFYRPERTTILVVGDTTIKEVVSVIKRTALWHMSDVPAAPVKEPSPIAIKWNAHTEVGLSGNMIRIVCAGPTTARDIMFFLLIVDIINDMSVVSMRWKVIHELELYEGMKIDDEELEFGQCCSYALVAIWGPSQKILKRMERAFFSWVEKVNKSGLSRDIFLRVYNRYQESVRLGMNDECWWAESFISMITGGSLSALELFINPDILGAEEVKKEVERVFRATIGGKHTIFRIKNKPQ